MELEVTSAEPFDWADEVIAVAGSQPTPKNSLKYTTTDVSIFQSAFMMLLC